MKRRKGRYPFCTVIMIVSLLWTLCTPVPTEETEGIVNGSFETVENGAAAGWNLVEADWSVLKTGGASGKGEKYIDLSATDTSKNFGLEQNVKIEKNQTMLLSFFYKSTIKSALTLDCLFYDSEAPVHRTVSTKKVEFAATNGEWKKQNLIMEPTESEIETENGIYIAVPDSVTVRFRNVSKALGTADTNVGLDAVFLRPYDNMLLDGGFDDAEADWSPTEKNSGDVTFENGYVKMTGAAGNAYVSQTASTVTPLVPFGFSLTRFRVSFKFKTDMEGTVPTVKLFDVPAAGGETVLNLTKRQTTDCGDGWTEYVYYSATSCATASKIGLMLRGTADGTTVYFDDVSLTPAAYWVYDNTINEVSALTAGSKINVSAIVANRTDASVNALVVVAFYEVKAGVKTLLSTKVLTQSVDTLKTAECRIQNITVPVAENGGTLEMHSFVLDGMKPMSTVGVLTQ